MCKKYRIIKTRFNLTNILFYIFIIFKSLRCKLYLYKKFPKKYQIIYTKIITYFYASKVPGLRKLRRRTMLASVKSMSLHGLSGYLVDVQVDVGSRDACMGNSRTSGY